MPVYCRANLGCRWVFSTETTNGGSQVQWDPTKSTTANKLDGYSWDIAYGDSSSAMGNVYTDVVNVGGVSYDTQAVESATQVSSAFIKRTELSGVFGLAMSSLNSVQPKQQLTFMDNVKSGLAQPLFTCDLRRQQPGKYNFGYIDDAAYTGEIAYTPADPNSGYWQFDVTGYQVGSGSGATYQSQTVTSIADTGTTLLLLPGTVVKDYYGQVDGAMVYPKTTIWVFPCSSTLPDLVLGMAGQTYTIPARYFNFQQVLTTPTALCAGGLQSSDSIGLSIVGDVALKAMFVVFDSGSTKQLGFASKVLTS
jgi:hypothetical protein